MTEIDKEVEKIVMKWGFDAVLGAMCRHCNRRGMPKIFNKLNKVYEWLQK